MVISRVHLFLEFSAEKCQSGFANEVSRRYIYPFRVRVMTSLCKELRQDCANLSGALFIDRMAADRSTCCSGLKTVSCNLARWKPFFFPPIAPAMFIEDGRPPPGIGAPGAGSSVEAGNKTADDLCKEHVVRACIRRPDEPEPVAADI